VAQITSWRGQVSLTGPLYDEQPDQDDPLVRVTKYRLNSRQHVLNPFLYDLPAASNFLVLSDAVGLAVFCRIGDPGAL
jgi:hypothetical protein